jgi:histidinol-phosphate phosphatase family protein
MSFADETPCSVAILVGGMGTRLKSRTGNIPKPMANLNGKPVLEHLIDLCRAHGYLRIALLAGFGSQSIQDHFGDGSAFGVTLTYSIENEPRGTTGALLDALPCLASRFLVLYGDTYADVDLRAIEEWHIANDSQATLFLHPNDHPEDSDLVEINISREVTAIHPYPHPTGLELRNLVNAAIYMLDKSAVRSALDEAGVSDIAKHVLPVLLNRGVRMLGYISPEYVKDMGTPDRLDKVSHHIAAGLPERLSGRSKRVAVFLDRDGTINAEAGHLANPDQLELLPGAAEAIRLLNRAGFLAIVVTNQPVIARGELDYSGLDRVHARLETLLGRDGAYLDAIYYCPHHPDRGFEGEIPELKMACDCRKPAIGMIQKAEEEFNISLDESWIIGDSTADILAGNRAGLKAILVSTGQGGNDGKYSAFPVAKFENISLAVNYVLSKSAIYEV